jgi:HEAT repeat protein
MFVLVMLMAAAAVSDDGKIERAFHETGARGVASSAEAIASDKGPAAAVKALSKLLQDEDLELRAAAAHALGRMGDAGKQAMPSLASALNKEGAEEFAAALNDLGPGDIPLWLAEAALHHDDAHDAYQALESLGLRDKRLAPILEKGLTDANFDVQWYAAVLLADMEAKAAPARAALVRLLQEEPKREKRSDEFFSPNEVRAKAAFALGCIGAEPDQTVRLLTAMLKHADPEIRIWSAIGLGRMGSRAKAAIPALIECLTDEKMILLPGGCIYSAHPDHSAATALVNIGEPALPALIGALDAKQASVRRHAADALWYFGPKAKPAVESLIRRLRDPEAEVRCKAANALGWIAPDGKEAVPSLEELLKDRNSNVRRAAAAALGNMGSVAESAVPALTKLLKATEEEVRAAAAQSLKEIEESKREKTERHKTSAEH